MKVTQCVQFFVTPMGCPWNSLGQNTGMGLLSLLLGIFSTQGLNPGLPHCRWIIYQLSHNGSPGILECVAYPFSSRSSQPRSWTGISCIAYQLSCLGSPSRQTVLMRITIWEICMGNLNTSPNGEKEENKSNVSLKIDQIEK